MQGAQTAPSQYVPDAHLPVRARRQKQQGGSGGHGYLCESHVGYAVSVRLGGCRHWGGRTGALIWGRKEQDGGCRVAKGGKHREKREGVKLQACQPLSTTAAPTCSTRNWAKLTSPLPTAPGADADADADAGVAEGVRAKTRTLPDCSPTAR